MDTQFYRAYYDDLHKLSDEELRQHWRNYGEAEGRYSDPQHAMFTLLGSKSVPEDFDFDCYNLLNPDVAANSRWPFEAILHYIEYGRSEGRFYKISENAAILETDLRSQEAPISHDGRLVKHDADRIRWTKTIERDGLRQIPANGFQAHPRSDLIPDNFNVAAYILNNPDIALIVKTDVELAIWHYLEFGLEEGRQGVSQHLDSKFLFKLYQYSAVDGDSIASVTLKLRAKLKRTKFDPLFFDLKELQVFYPLANEMIIEAFDHEYYRTAYLSSNFNDATFDICLNHFFNFGIEQTHNPSAEWGFDPSFYSSEYTIADTIQLPRQGNAAASDAALQIDWVLHGSALGRYPNFEIWAKKVYGVRVSNSSYPFLKIYSVAAELGENIARSAMFEHLLNFRSNAVLKININDFSEAELLLEVADRLALTDRHEAAALLYRHILAFFPKNTRARAHFADLTERTGNLGAALEMRHNMISSNSGNIWTYVASASIYRNLKDYRNEFKMLSLGSAAYPADAKLRTDSRIALDRAFYDLWKIAPTIALNRSAVAAQNEISACLEAYPFNESTPRHSPEGRVAIVGNFDLPQCVLYRIDQKAEQLRIVGIEVDVYNHAHDLEEFKISAHLYYAVIFFRVPAFPPIIDAIDTATSLGIPTYYDIDDLIFDGDVFPPSLETYSGSISPYEHAAIACGVPLFEHAMRLCDFGIASTPPLIEHVAKRVKSGQAFLHRNALGRQHTLAVKQPSVAKRSDVVTVFYGSGTRAHKQDFTDILEPALIKALKSFGGLLRIVLMGHFTVSDELASYGNQVIVIEPIWDIRAYWELLSTADINISVLEASLVNDCKSEIKWLEAAMFGIPSIVSPTATHLGVIRDGITAMFANTSYEFSTKLEDLLSNPTRRREIGQSARQYINENYSLLKLGHNLKDIISSTAANWHNSRKKKILVVNVFFAPQLIGGATRVVRDNVVDIKHLYPDEFEIDVVCTLEGGLHPYEIKTSTIDGVRVFSITSPLLADADTKSHDYSMYKKFSHCLDIVKPDLIHFHCIQRLTASIVDVAQDREIPYVITAHDGWWISPNQFIVDETGAPELYNYLNINADVRSWAMPMPTRASSLRKALVGAQKVLGVSMAFSQIYIDCGVPNVITVENGLSSFPTGAAQKPRETFLTIAHVGGVSRHKGFHLLKYALQSSDFKNLSLVVVDGSMDKADERHEKWGGTAVKFIGRVGQAAVGELYGSIDVLLAPSIWPESYGLVTREASAAGCWVVASNRGAIGSDIVEGENGYVISVDSPQPLIGVLQKLNDNVQKYGIRTNSTKPVRRSKDQANELVHLYRSIISSFESIKTSRT